MCRISLFSGLEHLYIGSGLRSAKFCRIKIGYQRSHENDGSRGTGLPLCSTAPATVSPRAPRSAAVVDNATKRMSCCGICRARRSAPWKEKEQNVVYQPSKNKVSSYSNNIRIDYPSHRCYSYSCYSQKLTFGVCNSLKPTGHCMHRRSAIEMKGRCCFWS